MLKSEISIETHYNFIDQVYQTKFRKIPKFVKLGRRVHTSKRGGMYMITAINKKLQVVTLGTKNELSMLRKVPIVTLTDAGGMWNFNN